MAAKPVTKAATKPKAPAATPVVKSATAAKKTPATKATITKPVPAKQDVAKVTAKKQKSAEKKPKTIRDSFNMPVGDYALIGTMKKRAIASGRELKKSELLRAGLKALAGMTEAAFAQAIGAVTAIKTGRPVKKRK